MPHPVVSALSPVVLLILAGFVAARRGWVGTGSVKDLSNLVFHLLAPALLFRSLAVAEPGSFDLLPVLAYFLAAGLIFAGTLWRCGFGRRATVLAMANTYSNSVGIGIPLIGLAYGPAGLVTLLALVSLHSVLLLTSATLAIEIAVARESGAQERAPHLLRTLAEAVRKTLLHPVPLPILAGVLWARTGWGLPPLVDQTLALLGQAFAPLALVLVGVTLARTAIAGHWRGALGLALAKNLLHPALVWGFATLLGIDGLPRTVIVVAAALPIGANVFLFSQRYGVAEAEVTAAVGVSTLLALATVSLVMALA
ncbi:AEC family transporter [Pseudorhodoferax sp.]|uniref:AEC family transporter n=1 Tax=Pseudorhodoferax sp. TaxID=1993553 RepID=UPI0039E70247